MLGCRKIIVGIFNLPPEVGNCHNNRTFAEKYLLPNTPNTELKD
jgi:hypothetical protein